MYHRRFSPAPAIATGLTRQVTRSTHPFSGTGGPITPCTGSRAIPGLDSALSTTILQTLRAQTPCPAHPDQSDQVQLPDTLADSPHNCRRALFNNARQTGIIGLRAFREVPLALVVTSSLLYSTANPATFRRLCSGNTLSFTCAQSRLYPGAILADRSWVPQAPQGWFGFLRIGN